MSDLIPSQAETIASIHKQASELQRQPGIHKELRQIQLAAGMPALEPAWGIQDMGGLWWTGQDWSCIQCEAKLYPSIKAALDDDTVPPAITEVVRHS